MPLCSLMVDPKKNIETKFGGTRSTMTGPVRIEEVNQSLTELWDAALALHDLAEKAKPIIEAIEARWGKDVWERHRKSRASARIEG
jgi:hypothetical protein